MKGISGCEHGSAYELSLDDLSRALPPALSYSPLVIPLSRSNTNPKPDDKYRKEKIEAKAETVTLLRRDLYDARYQLISESEASSVDVSSATSVPKGATSAERPETLDYINNPSDLIPGVYEGGLKTWECSLDLVDYLANVSDPREDWVRGKRIIELGCGTAVPNLYLLHTLFSNPQRASSDADKLSTEIVLQDFNDLVLRLVTFPNVLLQWYASPLAEEYRLQHPPEDEVVFSPDTPGDMHITPQLISAFHTSLQEQGIAICFIAGSWQSLSDSDIRGAFPLDITLTSETIYETSSLPSLIALLKRCTQGEAKDVRDVDNTTTQTSDLVIEGSARLCLIAAKVLYFGVGGSVMEFERAITKAGGKTTTVLDRQAGVERKVMSIAWT
ncbi:uncharacterized protein FOMMEDRAFT_118786 [Fomitiporia mediterranea MF3/22]|uniref:uncharacterized protein n=1 Tax=Fomitiporia mediterranea (strain MF3/22) TaxID=694068 RepID=UPI0004408D6A|nr:uncharacterized protein FOMMEDRAFT_118786 [Fomitiporia mediterranea MF3/22]EJD05617.1 hypothetical protein FOMMEDRAFT_118786 [Fomitiporia mediterranea MF3/22]